MCLPGLAITLPTICDYDEYDIVDFGLKNKVDYIAVSFARYKSDLTNLRTVSYTHLTLPTILLV